MWDFSSPTIGESFTLNLDSTDPIYGIDLYFMCQDLGMG